MNETVLHPCILIAEDEPDIRELLTILLEDAGYRVVPVANGLEALQAASNQHFGLVILDVTMPILDGLRAANALRSASPGTRIAFHTAMDEDWLRKRDAEYDAYFAKPLNVPQFLERLTALM